MTDFVEFTGKSTEEALRKAEAHFSLPMGRLEVEVLSAGSSGLFGLLGAKKAKVRVRPLAGAGMEQDMAELAAVVSDSRRPRLARPTPAVPPPAAPTPASEDDDRTIQVPPAEMPAVPPASQAETVKTPSPASPQRLASPADDGQETVIWAAKPAPAAAVQSPAVEDEADLGGTESLAGDLEDEAEGAGDQRLEQDPQVLAHAQEVLTRLVTPLDATATVIAQSGPQGIELAVQGQEAGVLIGRRGQNLEALQYLVTRIVSHRCGRPVRIVVDAGDYRRRRREALEDLAQRMAAKARQSGRAVAVGPLSAQERRVVHLALKGEPGLTTSSRGRGELKKVVISSLPRTGQ